MQSLLPKDDEPIKPIQPPQPQQAPQAAPPQGYTYPPQNYPPPNYPPPNYPPQGYAPQPQPAPAGSNLKVSILMVAVAALIAASGYLFYQLSEVRTQVAETKESLLAEIER